MFKNWLITTFRNLIRDKYYSTINILGLAVGLTVAIFIILYVFDEITYDQDHLQYDRIYRLESDFTINNKNDKFAITQVPLGPTLKDEYPEIEEFARCINIGTQYFRYGDKEFTEDTIFLADSTFFAIKRWLQDFQYRIDIGIWLFLFALLLSWTVAIITTTWQSVKASTANPAQSLKHE